jgi:hypothetical protein
MSDPLTALSVIDSIDTNIVATTLNKIHQFQQIVQQTLKPGHDYGIIPGTDKPSLFKPGAEKIVMLMGLSSRFDIIDKVEDYDKGFFSYNTRCVLSRNNYDICEGVGNCNSRESKYIKADPFTIANTILKMAKKRAYVDASLSVASLSDIFTQDIEDLPDLLIKSGPSHRDNQGVPLLEQVMTMGKHKGRTLGDLLENERQYLEWLAGSDNQKWAPIAQQVLEEAGKDYPADGDTGEDAGSGIPPAVLKMAQKAGMPTADLIELITAKFNKDWNALPVRKKRDNQAFA